MSKPSNTTAQAQPTAAKDTADASKTSATAASSQAQAAQSASQQPAKTESSTQPQPAAQASSNIGANADSSTQAKATTAPAKPTTAPASTAGQAAKPTTTNTTAAPAKPATTTATTAASQAAKAPTTKPATGASAAAAASTATTGAKTSTTAGASTAKKEEVKKPEVPTMTPEESKKLEDLKKQLEEKKAARLAKETNFDAMQRLVKAQTNLKKSQTLSQKLRSDLDAKNTKLEQEIIQLQVEKERETFVKELNNLKKTKKADAFIANAMKDQEAAIKQILANAKTSEQVLDMEELKLKEEIARKIPEQVIQYEQKTNSLKAEQTRLTKETQTIKDKIGEIRVREVRLDGLGRKKLPLQLQANSKTTITEQDITNYAQVAQKITKQLTDQIQLIPADNINERITEASPEYKEFMESPAKLMISPEPVAPVAGPANTEFLSAFVKDITGQDLFAQVQTQAKTAVTSSIQNDKSKFVDREEKRIRDLEQDKLESMRNIVAYQKESDTFADTARELNSQLEQTTTEKNLLMTALRNLKKDKIAVLDLMTQAAGEEAVPEEAEEDPDVYDEDFYDEEVQPEGEEAEAEQEEEEAEAEAEAAEQEEGEAEMEEEEVIEGEEGEAEQEEQDFEDEEVIEPTEGAEGEEGIEEEDDGENQLLEDTPDLIGEIEELQEEADE